MFWLQVCSFSNQGMKDMLFFGEEMIVLEIMVC